MANPWAFLLLVALSSTQATCVSEMLKHPSHVAPVVWRAVSRVRKQTVNRRSLPAVLQFFSISRDTVSLNPETLRTLPAKHDPKFEPHPWKTVSRCLRRLQRLGAEQQAAIVCAAEPGSETCLAEVREWIVKARVIIDTFALVRVGYKRRLTESSALGLVDLILPEPHMLARLDRLGSMCADTSKIFKGKDAVIDYVGAMLATAYFHPSSINAWCEYVGIPEKQSIQLRKPSKLPLWYQAALSFYIMHTQPSENGQVPGNVFSAISFDLLQPSKAAQARADMMKGDSLQSYLEDLNKLLEFHGGPFNLSMKECAERVTYWVVKISHGLADGV